MNTRTFHIVIFIISFVFSFLLLRYGVIAGLDGGMFMFPNSLEGSLYYWSSSNGLGDTGSAQSAFIILNIFRLLFGENIFLYQFLLFGLFYFSIFKGFEYILKNIIKIFCINNNEKKLYFIIILTALFYIFIPINVTYRMLPLIGNSYFFYILPIVFGLALNFFVSYKFKDGLLLAFIIILLSFVMWTVAPVIGLIIFLLIFYLILIFTKKIKFSGKNLFFIVIIVFLLNLFWFLPFVITGQTALSHGATSIEPVGNIQYLRSLVKSYHIFFLYPSEHWEMIKSASGFYNNSFIFSLWSLFLITIIGLFLLTNINRILRISLLLLWIIFIDLSSPSGFFSNFLIENISKFPLLALYRTSFDKLIYFPTIIVSIIFALVLLNKIKDKYIAIISLVLIFILSFPLLFGLILRNGNNINFTSNRNIPEWYFTDFKKLNELGGLNRILFLPLFSNDRVINDNGYFGLDYYGYFSSLPILSNYSERNINTKDLLHNIDTNNIKEFNKKIIDLGVKYIILKPDVNSLSYNYSPLISLNTNNSEPISQKNIILNNENIEFYKNIGIFQVYLNKGFKHGLFIGNGKFNIKKISPVQYKIEFKNFHNEKINFLESFNPNWKLYLEPYSELSCKNPTNYTGTIKEESKSVIYIVNEGDTFEKIVDKHLGITVEEIKELNPGLTNTNLKIGQKILIPDIKTKLIQKYNVTECESENKFYVGGELSKLWKKPIFEDSHKMVYDYANSWTIDPEYIKANYSKDYYKENPDGSIDVKITLYFKPQSYLYLGLIISATTFVSLISYLIFDSLRKRRKNKKNQTI